MVNQAAAVREVYLVGASAMANNVVRPEYVDWGEWKKASSRSARIYYNDVHDFMVTKEPKTDMRWLWIPNWGPISPMQYFLFDFG